MRGDRTMNPRPKYRQPHSIHAPRWMNEALAEKYIERTHHYEKYNARYKVQEVRNYEM